MTSERDESAFVGHESCPKCGSRDNLARYASGRGHRHGCGHNEFPDDNGRPQRQATPKTYNIEPDEPYEGTLGGEDVTKAYGITTATRRTLGISLVASGPFMAQQDTAGCGQHIASDPVILLDFLTR